MKILTNKMKVYIIITVTKAVLVVLSYTKHLTKNEKNIKTHFAYEDDYSDYGHMDVYSLDIVIFFVKPNGSIDHLIGYENVKKRFSHIDIFV